MGEGAVHLHNSRRSQSSEFLDSEGESREVEQHLAGTSVPSHAWQTRTHPYGSHLCRQISTMTQRQACLTLDSADRASSDYLISLTVRHTRIRLRPLSR